MKRMLTILFAAVLLTGGLTQPAQAALQAVGPTALFNPGGFTFPVWYQDFAGLRLDLCALMAPVEPFCFAEGPPAAGTFPDELFWWSGEAFVLPTDPGANGTDGLLVMAMEAAFVTPVPDGAPLVGQEVAFARIRLRIDVPTPGTYTVSHPFGSQTYVVAAVDVAGGGGAPEINETQDIGNLADPGPLGNFALALADGPGGEPGLPPGNVSTTNASIGPFLRPSATPGGVALPPIPGQVVTQALFIANPLVPTNVTGSPVGQNFFRIVGPGVDVTQNLFNVLGLVSGTQPAQVDKAEYRVKTGKFHVEGFSLLKVDALGAPTVITVRLGDALGPVIGTATVNQTSGIWTVTSKVPFSPGGGVRNVTVQSTAGADATFGLTLR